MSIKVAHLTRIFDEQKAVDDLSFEIQPGNIVGFLGPNGAGKSTTMKMLTTFLPASSGKAWVCGFDIAKDAMEVRRNVGYLPEKNPLYYDMYVREFLSFTAGVHQLGKLKKSRVAEMIEVTGLEKEARKKIGTLSKGYKQRVGLAQAMIHHPKVLILDEPTSGLDPNQIVEIRELILNIGKERTVLLSSHIMQEVQAMCSRVIILNNGKLVADDQITNIQRKSVAASVLLCVEFDRTITAEELAHFSGVETLKQTAGNRWLLQTEHPDRLRREIMAWSLEKEVTILSLNTESRSLEAVFRELTKGT